MILRPSGARASKADIFANGSICHDQPNPPAARSRTARRLHGGAYLGWQAWQSGRALNALSEVVQSMDMEAILRGKVDALPGGKKEGGDTVDLALRGISLSEGENGL